MAARSMAARNLAGSSARTVSMPYLATTWAGMSRHEMTVSSG
jgi:hypothetical protein